MSAAAVCKHDIDLQEKINTGLTAICDEGTDEKIVRRYFRENIYGN